MMLFDLSANIVQERLYYIYIVTVNVSIALVIMLAACLCCKKNLPKNDMMGLEGMVKLKNPDDIVITTTLNTNESCGELNLSTVSQGDSEKRTSTAVHRSLPDIPAAEANGDTGSELYEIVADKVLRNGQNLNKSPTISMKKQISVSQHSSISQADDVSSPYSRVKNSPHDYAKVRPTEHPYAQLNKPSTSQAYYVDDIDSKATTTATLAATATSDICNRNSQHSSNGTRNETETITPIEIPAASAIAGMVSASQDLPYMTPPLATSTTATTINQHFSGDSQDSSKGYTSISVREPLANILAQQTAQQPRMRMISNVRDGNDSHYATVSDDSDETYAAIEDSNLRQTSQNAEIYTSGSETYAQIQPMQSLNSIMITVEINNTSTTTLVPSSNSSLGTEPNNYAVPNQSLSTSASSATVPTQHMTHAHTIGALRNSLDYNQISIPPPLPVDSLRAQQQQMHSRQASSSSNNSSSLYNLGSPKPEKRQANSPLPPTPKSNISTTSNSNITSGRNSVISVAEYCGNSNNNNSNNNVIHDVNEIELRDKVQYVHNDSNVHHEQQRKNKNLSPSKDIEGMYAKVMKKNKFSRNSPSSQNSSPVLSRKLDDLTINNTDSNTNMEEISSLDTMAADLLENKCTQLYVGNNDKNRIRCNSYNAAKDHGYETIPGDTIRQTTTSVSGIENRRSDSYTQHLLQKHHHVNSILNTTTKLPNATYNSQQIKHNPQQHQTQLQHEKYYEAIAVTSTEKTITPATPTTTITTTATVKTLTNHIIINDPDYETVANDQPMKDSTVKSSSDYDPNYEVLLNPHNIVEDNISIQTIGVASDDYYAKVIERKLSIHHHSDDDSGCGYSKVGEANRKPNDNSKNDSLSGYSTIDSIKSNVNHNYASILETKQEAALHLDSESDHYAKIGETLEYVNAITTMNKNLLLPKTDVSPTKLIINDDEQLHIQSSTMGDLTTISPNSLASSSLLNTSSVNSSSNITTTSTSSNTTISSRQMATSCSQYESLTGSETDPNYESVCYLNSSSQENAYERLYTDISDTQLSNSSTQISLCGDTSAISLQLSNNHYSVNEQQHSKILPITSDIANNSISNNCSANGPNNASNNGSSVSNNDIMLNDYFHV